MSPTRLKLPLLAVSSLAAVLCVAPAALAQAPLVGWISATRSTVDSGPGIQPIVRKMRTVKAGGRMRIETYTGDDSLPASIALMDSAAGSMTSIMPAQRMAMVIASPAGAMTGMSRGIKMSPVGKRSFHRDTLGTGPVLLGHPTQHFVETTHGTMRTKGRSFTCDETKDSRYESWVTADSIGPPESATTWLMGAKLRRAIALNAKRVASHPPRHPAPPTETLRSQTVTTVTRRDGVPVTVKSTEETTEWSYGPIDSTLFLPPAGYRVMDTRASGTKVDFAKLMDAMTPSMELNFCGPARKRS